MDHFPKFLVLRRIDNNIVNNTWAHIHPETAFALATQRKWNGHKQHEIYMANVRVNARRPNVTYIPPAWLGIFRVALGPQGFLDTNMLV